MALIIESFMFYKIKDTCFFRNYHNFGYITDNSLFGYSFLNDKKQKIGEKYVSKSGAFFLSALTKNPQSIDLIVNQLLQLFNGVSRKEIRDDAIAFFNDLANEGFLSCGKSFEECNSNQFIEKDNRISKLYKTEPTRNFIKTDNFLRSLHIEIARTCNEHCIHCYIPHNLKNGVIEPDFFYRIVEEGRKLNILNVTFTGSEPLTHKDICKFLKCCREHDLSVNLLSNLTLLNDEIFCEIKRNPLVSVQTSIYSMNEKVHDYITQSKGSLEKTKNAVLKLIDSQIPVQIVCPIMKQNKDDFYSVIQWGNEHNLQVNIDYMIFAQYDHSKKNLANRLSLEDVVGILDKQFVENKSYKRQIETEAELNRKLTELSPICSICRYYFCISLDGKVFPCEGWQEYEIGDLNRESLAQIWNASEKIKYLREIKRKDFPKCMKCKDKDFCTICMMKNFNESKDSNMFQSNPFNCRLSEIIHSKILQYKDI